VTPCSVVIRYQSFGGQCCLHLQVVTSEDGGGIVLRNVGVLPQQYTASRLRRPRLESSLPWKPQISHTENCWI